MTIQDIFSGVTIVLGFIGYTTIFCLWLYLFPSQRYKLFFLWQSRINSNITRLSFHRNFHCCLSVYATQMTSLENPLLEVHDVKVSSLSKKYYGSYIRVKLRCDNARPVEIRTTGRYLWQCAVAEKCPFLSSCKF